MDLIHNEQDTMSDFCTFLKILFLLENVKDFSHFMLKASCKDGKNVIDIENGNFYLPVIAHMKLNRGRRLGFCLV